MFGCIGGGVRRILSLWEDAVLRWPPGRSTKNPKKLYVSAGMDLLTHRRGVGIMKVDGEWIA